MSSRDDSAAESLTVHLTPYLWDSAAHTSRPGERLSVPATRGHVTSVGRLEPRAAGGPFRRDLRAGDLGSFPIGELPRDALVLEPLVRGDGRTVVAIGCEPDQPERWRLRTRSSVRESARAGWSAEVHGDSSFLLHGSGLVQLQYAAPRSGGRSWATVLSARLVWPLAPDAGRLLPASSVGERRRNTDAVLRDYFGATDDDVQRLALALAVLAVASADQAPADGWPTPDDVVAAMRDELDRMPDDLDVLEIEQYLDPIDPSSLSGLPGAQALAAFLVSRSLLPVAVRSTAAVVDRAAPASGGAA